MEKDVHQGVKHSVGVAGSIASELPLNHYSLFRRYSIIHPRTRKLVSDARKLTGWHEPTASHLLMLEAVAGRRLLVDSYAEALRAGYRWHEFGDLHLILPR